MNRCALLCNCLIRFRKSILAEKTPSGDRKMRAHLNVQLGDSFEYVVLLSSKIGPLFANFDSRSWSRWFSADLVFPPV